jgi:sugar transferase (PEP-CTERM/EpsH1 system associated)
VLPILLVHLLLEIWADVLSNILYLVHRIPFPPNKGDKVRSFHLLKYLSLRHDIYLAAFIDDPFDRQYIPQVEKYCADVLFLEINPFIAKCRSIFGIFHGAPLTLGYYYNITLKNWVDSLIVRNKIDRIIIFSSAMAQYVDHINDIDILIDFVDVDSAKWSEYALKHFFPMSLVYRRESIKLLEYERSVAIHSKQSFFVTDNEASLFNSLAPECVDKISTINNGVDAEYFSTDFSCESPFEKPILETDSYFLVFTGAMDYWPNVDAVTWFSSEILPKLHNIRKNVYFYIVGRNPSAQVLALASDHVVVTGTVADVRPYLKFASVVVAPLRVARGIQNKILEAMAMECPVVASDICVNSMAVEPNRDLLSAGSSDEFFQQINKLLDSAVFSRLIGKSGRRTVQEKYSWTAHLSHVDKYLDSPAF